MKCAVCAIAKLENNYLREFVEYHLSLGYDKIFLGDNNDCDGERFEEVIADHIESGDVIVSDRRGEKMAQYPHYTDIYNRYCDEYDWITVIDIDEFITLVDHNNIKDFLQQPIFDDFNVIQINWLCFGDSGHIQKSEGGVIERFTESLGEKWGENRCTKSTVRGHLKGLSFHDSHVITYDAGCGCGATGKARNYTQSRCCAPIYEGAYIRHYMTKSLEEYIVSKFRRQSCGDMPERKAKLRLNLSYFWAKNRRTPEKLAFTKKFMTPEEYKQNRYFEREAMVRGWMRKMRYRYMYPFLQKIGFKRNKVLQ